MEYQKDTTENAALNQDVFAGWWRQMRGTLRSWWGKLTDDDVEKIAGQKDKLIGLLQEKYGYARETAAREVERRFQEYAAQMSSARETLGQAVKTTANDFSQHAVDAARTMQAKAQDFGATAAEKARGTATTVGETVHSLAGMIRQNVSREGTMGAAATTVADGLDSAGAYLQENGFANMTRDLTALIRRYPLQSLLIGIVIGYVMASRSER